VPSEKPPTDFQKLASAEEQYDAFHPSENTKIVSFSAENTDDHYCYL